MTLYDLRRQADLNVQAGVALFDIDNPPFTGYLPWLYHAAIAAAALFGPGPLTGTPAIHMFVHGFVQERVLRAELAGFPSKGDTGMLGEVLDRAKSFLLDALDKSTSGFHLTRYKNVTLGEDGWSVIRAELSCAGLVEWCYEMAGLDLVNEQDLPPIEISRRPGIRNEEWRRVRDFLRTYADEPPQEIYSIRTLCPGYQMVAFQNDDYPYTPVAGDEKWG